MAATDGLTSVANRRTFEAALEVELSRAARGGTSVSLVMLDIDHFKSLNDTHGHQVGDEVLRGVAAVLTQQSRAFDTPARYGGEEFAVVMPGCDVADAQRGAERLRRAIEAMDTVAKVTVSAGVATFPVHAADAEALVQMADGAMYQSKRAGRNTTSVAQSLVEGADQLLSELTSDATHETEAPSTNGSHGPVGTEAPGPDLPEAPDPAPESSGPGGADTTDR
jgi:diguanylate cyclase (GGDEF)-like protein